MHLTIDISAYLLPTHTILGWDSHFLITLLIDGMNILTPSLPFYWVQVASLTSIHSPAVIQWKLHIIGVTNTYDVA
jgi:hypothetical protein